MNRKHSKWNRIVASVALYGLSSCSAPDQNLVRPHLPMEQTATVDQEIQLPDQGPKLKLFRRGEKYFYLLSYKGSETRFESHVREAPSTGGPAFLEITFSNHFRNLVIREDLTDGAPEVFYIYLAADSGETGTYRAAYWALPTHQFDTSTPLGVESPFVEKLTESRAVLHYRASNQRRVLNISDITSSVAP